MEKKEEICVTNVFGKGDLVRFSCFETIKHCVFVLKLELKKIKLQVELDISNVEFYANFAI